MGVSCLSKIYDLIWNYWKIFSAYIKKPRKAAFFFFFFFSKSSWHMGAYDVYPLSKIPAANERSYEILLSKSAFFICMAKFKWLKSTDALCDWSDYRFGSWKYVLSLEEDLKGCALVRNRQKFPSSKDLSISQLFPAGFLPNLAHIL